MDHTPLHCVRREQRSAGRTIHQTCGIQETQGRCRKRVPRAKILATITRKAAYGFHARSTAPERGALRSVIFVAESSI